jgi:hypothetical protein
MLGRSAASCRSGVFYGRISADAPAPRCHYYRAPNICLMDSKRHLVPDAGCAGTARRAEIASIGGDRAES